MPFPLCFLPYAPDSCPHPYALVLMLSPSSSCILYFSLMFSLSCPRPRSTRPHVLTIARMPSPPHALMISTSHSRPRPHVLSLMFSSSYTLSSMPSPSCPHPYVLVFDLMHSLAHTGMYVLTLMSSPSTSCPPFLPSRRVILTHL